MWWMNVLALHHVAWLTSELSDLESNLYNMNERWMLLGWIGYAAPCVNFSFLQTLEIVAVYRRYIKEIIYKRHALSLQRCSSFSTVQLYKKMNLWSLLCHNIFIQGAGWIKYWFVTPFALPCFLCFPAFSFWWIITVPKGKYILVAQFPSVYCCWYFPFIFPFLLDAVLCILHLRASPMTIGY